MSKAALLNDSASGDMRERILAAAAALIRAHGPEAATTRAGAAAASAQAPVIYRLFGDKDALLDAVAEYELAAYVTSKKKRAPHSDPVEELRNGWDRHVAFGLAHPGLFSIMTRNPRSPAAVAGLKVLAGRVHAIAVAGRLRGSEERATALVHAACVGTVLTLLVEGNQQTHAELSMDAREAALTAITAQKRPSADVSVKSAATTLRARLAQSSGVLTQGERGLLDELLLRLSNA
jgi:AcrR family transcriptional regulator